MGVKMRLYLKSFVVAMCVIAPGRTTGAQVSSDVSQNAAIVRQHLALVNAGKWQEASEFLAIDVRHHLGSWQGGAEGVVEGRAALARNFEDIFRTFPDWRMDIVELVTHGDDVIVRCRVSGTHRGVSRSKVNAGFLYGVQPTGKRFEVQHIHWYKVRDGKIADHYANRDDAGMARQLGLLPPSG